MPDPAETRIVVNSLVLGELAAQIGEESGSTRSDDGNLLAVLRRCKHIVCTTSNINKEYSKTEGSNQYPQLQGILTPALRQLRVLGILRQCKTGAMPDAQMLAGFSKQHIVFLQDALRINAAYLLTVNQIWLEKATVGEVQIVSSARYVQLQES